MPELILASDDDMGGSAPMRTWFLQYIGSIGDLIRKAMHAMVEKHKSQYEKGMITKMNAETCHFDEESDFRIRSVKLYILDKAGVNMNRTMNITNSLLPQWTSRTDILQALSIHRQVSVTIIKIL